MGGGQMKLPLKITIGEKSRPAMEIQTQAEADAYFEKLVSHNLRLRRWKKDDGGRKEAEEVERHNLGYYAGYYDSETRRRVELLFKCVHPVFGSIERNGEPTPEEVSQAG